MTSSDVLYREATVFSHSLVWIVVIGITFCSIYFALPQLFLIASDKSPSASIDVASSIFLAIGMILPCLLLAIKLRVQVRGDGLYVKVIPFQLSFRKIPLGGLKKCEPYARTEKGENKLGLARALSKQAYSLGGGKGVLLEFEDGKKLAIESRRPEKITEAIRAAGNA